MAKLADAGSYIWRTQARDPYQDAAWTSASTFSVGLVHLGARSTWPLWSNGPLAVNESNGNLVLSLPTPSYPTAVGSLGLSLAYNSQDSVDHGLGTGWTLVAGDDSMNPPVKLVDHNILTGAQKLDAAEVVWPDGSSDYYNHVGTTSTYLAGPGDGSQLTKNTNTDGSTSWTLLDTDGTIYAFGASDGTTGVALLSGAQTSATASGHGTLSYGLDAQGRVTSLTFKDTPTSTGRTLTFNWGCSGARLCVTGPDGVTWKYIGTGGGGSSGQIAQVYDGARTLLQLSYDASSRVSKVQNADDLDPSHASPGYNGLHALAVTYDNASPARVTCAINGPITGQAASTQPACAGGGSASESTWTFAYHPGTLAATPTRAAHGSLPPNSARSAAGYATVTPPNQQPSGSVVSVYYDTLGRTMERDDARLTPTRVTEVSYNDQNQLAWSEDEDGNPTDNTYDSVNNVLLSSTGPAGPLGRPVTSYRYDEQTIGTATQPGTPLTGLAGSYWKNTNLAGSPDARQNDAQIAFDPVWTPPVSGTGGVFSARWTGDLSVPGDGHYTFSTVSDGATRLTVDGISAIDNWTTPQAGTVSSEPIQLTAGLHKLLLEYQHTTGSAQLELHWACADCNPAITDAAIPSASLLPAWMNETSEVSPSGRVSFHHFLVPASAQPDYDLTRLADGTNLITSYKYDDLNLGRTTKSWMPKANAGRTPDPTTGNLPPSPAPDPTYETDYTYYADTDQAAPPSACPPLSPVNQGEQLETTSTYGLHNITTVYDAAGRPLAITNGKGTTCMSYDTGGESRLVSTIAPGYVQATIYSYDPNGNQLSANDSSGTITSNYDEAGRLADSTDSSGAEANFTYDSDGNILQRTAASGPLASNPNYQTQYSYDAADRLISETDPAGRSYSFYYDNRGNLRGTQYPNGTFSWADTNPLGELSDLYNRHGTISSATTSAPADSSPLADYAYSYNLDGRRTEEDFTTGTNAQQVTAYGYDNLGRLSEVLLPSGTCRDYLFDLDSNRTQIKESPTGCLGTFSTVVSYTYDPSTTPGTDELTSITQGSNTTNYGYTTYGDGQVASEGTNSLTWDGWGRFSSATFAGTTVSYTYDATGALKTRTSNSPAKTTNYLLGDLFETDNTGTIATTYAVGPAGDLASFNGPPTTSSTVSYLYYNGHGDLAAEVDQSGASTATHAYDPFGAPLDTPPANSTIHRFTGRWAKQYDTSTGLILMGERPYDPNTGRFLAVDPVPGGSLNNYDYAGQDPINGYDLTGTRIDNGPPSEQVPPEENEQGLVNDMLEGRTAEGRGKLALGSVLRDPYGFKNASYAQAKAVLERDARAARWRIRPTKTGLGVRLSDPKAPGVQIRIMRPSPNAPPGSPNSEYRLVVSNGRGGPPIHVRLKGS